jgi:deoxyribodipyrimidine photo-lyase
MLKKGIYWFTTDLRLDDNPALKMAVEAMDQLIFVYSVNITNRLSRLQVGSSISQNRQVFLSGSLHCLNDQLQDLGQHLVVIDNTQSEMAQLIDDHGITHIYRNSDQHALDSAEWLKIQTDYPQINFFGSE